MALALLLSAVSTGCASGTGARDAGAARRLSPPVSASPLWPEGSASGSPAARTRRPGPKPYPAVEGVTVPPHGGFGDVPVRTLLARDPSLPGLVRKATEGCPGGSCALRRPVHRDLTGDGRDELVVAVDEPAVGQTLLVVYRVAGGKVRPILVHWGEPGLTGETAGRELILAATGKDGPYTTRYRWNGEVMAAVTADGGPYTGTGQPGPAGERTGTSPGAAGDGRGTATGQATATATGTTTGAGTGTGIGSGPPYGVPPAPAQASTGTARTLR